MIHRIHHDSSQSEFEQKNIMLFALPAHGMGLNLSYYSHLEFEA